MLKLQNFCEKNRVLRRILQGTEELVKLTPIFKQAVGQEFAAHCHLAKINDGKLIVIIDSPVWATKFRYATPDILKNLCIHPEFKRVRELVCRISFVAQVKTIVKPRPVLSSESANFIVSAAKGIKNSGLKRALLRLAGMKNIDS